MAADAVPVVENRFFPGNAPALSAIKLNIQISPTAEPKSISSSRLIGISRRSLLLFLCAEALGIAVVGSAAGIGLGRLAAALVNAYYQRFYDTSLTFAAVTPHVAVASLALGIGFGLLAGLTVSAWILRMKPLEILGR